MQAPGALLEAAPAGTCCILATHVVFSILSVTSHIVARFCALSVYGFSKGHFASLASYWMLAPGFSASPFLWLLTLILSAWAALMYFAQVEREYGTLRFVIWFLMGTISVGLLYLLVMFIIAQFSPQWQLIPCVGLWPPLIIAMTQRALAAPEEATVPFWGLAQIPARWYPLVLIGFFSLLSMQLEVDLLSAWFLGVAAYQAEGGTPLHPLAAPFRIPLHRLMPSPSTITAFEDAVSGGGLVLGGAVGAATLAQRWLRFLRRMPEMAARRFVSSCPASMRSRYVRCGAAAPGGGSAGASSSTGAKSRPDITTFGAPTGGTIGSKATASAAPRSFVPFSGSGQRLGEASGSGDIAEP